MYEEYFGFAEKPFSLTPDPRYLYGSECHRSALDIVQYGVRRHEGLIVVTGETGTGKTSLCRALVDRCSRDTFPSLVLNPFLSPTDLLRRLLQDFGIVSRGDLRTGHLSEVSDEQLLGVLRDFLLSLMPESLHDSVASVSVQQVVAAIKSSGRHGWVTEFELKYGLV